MLLQYHSNILLISLYILNKSNSINDYNLIDKLISYNVSSVEEIHSSVSSAKINITNNDIDLLFSGLIFPDLTCGTFYIENNRIIPRLTICKVTKLKLANNENNVDSQLFQSHNDYFAINHSMANDVKLTNLETRNLIIERILSLAYEFLEFKKFDFLGYIIHIIHDSWSGGHVTRVQGKQENTFFKNTNNIVSEIKNNNLESKFILNEENFSYLNISNIINIILNNSENVNLLFTYIKQNKSIAEIINIILDILINICRNNNIDNQKINIFLNNIISDKTITKIINKKYIINKKLNIQDYNKNLDILNNLKYDDIPRKLLRIYKLFMNRLFTVQNINNISEEYTNLLNDDDFTKMNFVKNNTMPQISSFRYYVTQNHTIHILSDCKTNYKLYETSNYKHAIIDTLNILNILLSNNNDNNTKLIMLSNYLLNYTYSLNENKNKNIESSDMESVIDGKLKKVSKSTHLKCIVKSTGYVFGNRPNYKNIKKYFNSFNKKEDLLYNNNTTFDNVSEEQNEQIEKTIENENNNTENNNTENTDLMLGGNLYYYKKYLKYKQKYLLLQRGLF